MTPEKVIELANQAGMQKLPGRRTEWACHLDELQRFAVLAGNAKLEEAAKVCDEQADRAITSMGATRAGACADRIRSMKT